MILITDSLNFASIHPHALPRLRFEAIIPDWSKTDAVKNLQEDGLTVLFTDQNVANTFTKESGIPHAIGTASPDNMPNMFNGALLVLPCPDGHNHLHYIHVDVVPDVEELISSIFGGGPADEQSTY